MTDPEFDSLSSRHPLATCHVMLRAGYVFAQHFTSIAE
jgi:hypothetical protein